MCDITARSREQGTLRQLSSKNCDLGGTKACVARHICNFQFRRLPCTRRFRANPFLTWGGIRRRLSLSALHSLGIEALDRIKNDIRIDIGSRIINRFTDFLAHDFVERFLFAIERPQRCAQDPTGGTVRAGFKPRIQLFCWEPSVTVIGLLVRTNPAFC
ncbi:hypothetical protein EV132_102382 [Rhizobium sullae]|uniref:Uncharacterized protein n=1 Tax=Rhizobium sullae TaxID=50338 RepID=A0A4R3QC92_RHISU|nr:hypothetical protein EV132_102382 [Rhizobium sullae]